ncbi:MAG: hypothetical protein R2770_16540 [Acidimicrobiales bacterium]
MSASRVRPDIFVLDDAFSDDDLAVIGEVARSANFEPQDLNRGTFTPRQRVDSGVR